MKKFILLSVTAISLLSALSISVNASETFETKVESNNTAIGGWSEDEGTFSNILETRAAKATVKHSGKAEYKNAGPNQEKRSHGWTTWSGVYHYTTAQMQSLTGKVLSTSGRKWGTSGTEAISPYVWVGEIPGSAPAKTFYGK
ncbi:hypothetical protein FQS90_05935 [Enterococcus casseliflavus]|uniref:hypothetical protein n=1 Tax=Enterococcus sp. AZ009 TaxID=2774766 RepID=UPI001A96CC43|nr:hypothetical protein [Enterococcus casseliflavus]MBO1145958.1 hypothetical protein [Enterococcus casseliflavus]MBV6372324.1 hypothetical protein [Enterococcus casseliflavus]